MTDTNSKHADKLGKTMKRRLLRHIRKKVTDTAKHNHPALLFVRANLNRFIALMCMYGQARKSPVMNTNSCILEHPSKGGFLIAVDPDLEGSYLHYFEDNYY